MAHTSAIATRAFPPAVRAEPLKVVHAVLTMDMGGLERIVLELVRESRRLAQRAMVLCLERPGKLARDVELLGGEVLCVHKRPGLSLTISGKVRQLLSEVKPDVVHTHQIAALLYAGPAARNARVPVIVHTEHGKHYAARFRTRMVGRLAGRSAARFFCVSEDIANEVRKYRIARDSKIVVVANGIDTCRFADDGGSNDVRESLGIPANAPVVGTVGRLVEVKRQDVLLHGFARVRARIPNAHLVLVGDGPLEDSLRQLAAGLGLADCVHFVGYQPDPRRFLRAMDVFALTSRSEGMPLSVLEAWATGLPVVASRVGGLPQLIEEGRTGFLFESGNDDALAQGIEVLLADKRQARAIGQAGRDYVRAECDVAKMADTYQSHYLRLRHTTAPF
jgi:glycosyltransferase involved in cell wall biosynthesis